jgi:hypothetical protein
MRIIKSIILLIVLTFNSNVYSQDLKDTASSVFPVSIYSVYCKSVDRDYVFDYRTHFSDDFVYKDGRNFAVDLNLRLNDTASVADSSIGVIIQSWHGDFERYILNPKYAIAKTKYYYHFVFDFRARPGGIATCRLVRYNKIDNSYTPVSGDTKLLSTDFFLQ